MFGRATIRLGIGPHSSFTYVHCSLPVTVAAIYVLESGYVQKSVCIMMYCNYWLLLIA